MTTFATHSRASAARRAVAALRGNGSAQHVRLLIGGCTLHDARRGQVDGFTGPVTPDDTAGSFTNRPGERRRGSGSFAGDPDGQRQGWLADTNRVVILTRREGVERSRATGELRVGRLLRGMSLSEEVVVGAIGELRGA